MGNFIYIGDLLLKHKYRYVLGVIFLICVDVLQLIIPWILGEATNSLESSALTIDFLARFAIALALTAAGIAVFRFLFRYTLYGVSRSVELSFRNRLYAHLQKLSVNWFNTHKTGDLWHDRTRMVNSRWPLAGRDICSRLSAGSCCGLVCWSEAVRTDRSLLCAATVVSIGYSFL
jgi:ATP-binding cassette subfamily B protein